MRHTGVDRDVTRDRKNSQVSVSLRQPDDVRDPSTKKITKKNYGKATEVHLKTHEHPRKQHEYFPQRSDKTSRKNTRRKPTKIFHEYPWNVSETGETRNRRARMMPQSTIFLSALHEGHPPEQRQAITAEANVSRTYGTHESLHMCHFFYYYGGP